ncbi:MAG: hypothetical protein QOK43_149 [Acidimicrobiaceae bacterium]|jgi:hypothetical protein|nr:hypothetical protein [Acidimicrobiaceae bacterium]MDQ1444390.1 hypothetical protein [Acidimicrobiaceae bacterium]
MHLLATELLAALRWDPQIRGALIVLTAILILPGSVYLLLATNSGPRLGFLLAAAGLSGWLAVMGIVWMVFGIGLKGREPEWKPKELITGSLDKRTTVDAMSDFPAGWKKLKTGDATLADAQSAADRILVPTSAPTAGHEAPKGPTPEQIARFQSPFKKAGTYVQVAGYETGGDNQLFTLGHHEFFFRHSAHYAVIQVQPILDDDNDPNTTPNNLVPDTSQPVTTLIMVRDLGNIRLPPFLVALFALTVFGVTCSALHQRDKEIMRARGQAPATA